MMILPSSIYLAGNHTSTNGIPVQSTTSAQGAASKNITRTSDRPLSRVRGATESMRDAVNRFTDNPKNLERGMILLGALTLGAFGGSTMAAIATYCGSDLTDPLSIGCVGGATIVDAACGALAGRSAYQLLSNTQETNVSNDEATVACSESDDEQASEAIQTHGLELTGNV